MLGRLGFCDKWILWIKSCLEPASVSILVNRSPTKKFYPLKGLRQGDPLTPFLFLIVVEGLTEVSRKTYELDVVEILEIGNKKVRFNMLKYAYDTLFFGHANSKSVVNYKAMLNFFELTSGLKVNFLKSNIGGVGVESFTIWGFVAILNYEVMKVPFKYLGMPVGGVTGGKRSGMVWLIELIPDWEDGNVEISL